MVPAKTGNCHSFHPSLTGFDSGAPFIFFFLKILCRVTGACNNLQKNNDVNAFKNANGTIVRAATLFNTKMTTGNVWEYLYENNDISYLKLGISKL